MPQDALDGKGGVFRPPTQHVGFWERVRIRCAGLRDRLRTRQVSDDKVTHYLISLQERAQAHQVEILKWVSAEDARLAVAIAEQQVVVDRALPENPQTDAGPSVSRDKKERARWASSAREQVRAVSRARAAREQRDRALSEIASLKQNREELPELLKVSFLSCQQWFEERAAIYNRARTGCFGLPKSAEHRIPQFQHIEATIDRPPAENTPIRDHPGGVKA